MINVIIAHRNLVKIILDRVEKHYFQPPPPGDSIESDFMFSAESTISLYIIFGIMNQYEVIIMAAKTKHSGHHRFIGIYNIWSPRRNIMTQLIMTFI